MLSSFVFPSTHPFEVGAGPSFGNLILDKFECCFPESLKKDYLGHVAEYSFARTFGASNFQKQ